MNLLIETFTVMPFGENTYLVGDLDAGEAIVVDPGGRADEIVRVAERRGLRIDRIVNTHAHIDHVSGVAALQALTGASFWLHAEAEPMLAQLGLQAAMFGLPPLEPPVVDHHLVAGDRVTVGGASLALRYTPGHAPGHVTLVGPEIAYEGRRAPFALCGDVIFMGSIGRVDLPGGDYGTLMRVIEREILSLPDATLLLSGHGPATTVGQERQHNPFVRDWLARSGA
ncbi:MAG: MBL fold metallo-hydrolase [Caldilineae bacterium]|nr:MBL fold metallo-hydrolase [Chloroflexota bacterium]MCB9177568.1 MBL fold metallo-hydrolase [Caldilineae bacterium]